MTRFRRWLILSAVAAIVAGLVPVSSLGAPPSPGDLPDLAPAFPKPMSRPSSASAHGAPTGGPIDPRFITTPTPPDRVCRGGSAARVAHAGLHTVPRNGCAASVQDRKPIADQAYQRPKASPADADVGANVTRAVFTGGPPPTYPSPNWIQVQPSAMPSGRYGEGMAYDEQRQQVVLFGGYDGTTFYNDTWTWNGTTWTLQHPATSPSPRMWTQMVYDQTLQKIVLFGGQNLTTPAMADTWTWDGNTWTQLSPATSPPGRGSAAMAYDVATSSVVLFGGGGYTAGTGATDLGDTWTFNGTTWSQITSTPAPSARSGVRAAYDGVHNTVVLFGGQLRSGTFLGDTWTFNGSAWSQASPAAAPSARSDMFFAADPGLPGVVLFGGYDPLLGDVADTWRWDGTGWATASGIASPSGRDGGAMAFYAPSGQLVQFGGSDGFTNFNQTWIYNTGTPTATDVLSTTNASRGALVTYTITLGNSSTTTTIQNVAMNETLPNGMTVALVNPVLSVTDVATAQPVSCSSCSASGMTVSGTGLTLAPLQRIQFVFQVVTLGADRGCTQSSDTLVVSVGGAAEAPVHVSVTECDSGLGIQPWRSQVVRSVGPQGAVAVDPADGNMVLTQQDSVAVPDRGVIDLGLTRAYNSEDTGWQPAPATLGAGWVFTVGQERIATGGVTANGLLVPSQESYANNLPVTLVDGSGARSVFMPQGLSQPLDITGIVTASSVTTPLGALKPRQLAANLTTYDHVCVDSAYTAPAGIHLSLLRYVELVATSSSTPCTPKSGTTPVILGFMAERPDRVRDEFAWDGHLVDIVDGNGNELRYLYTATPAAGANLGTLNTVSNGFGDRSVSFTYAAGETDMTDPAGRVTRYQVDSSVPPRLTTVTNPDGSRLTYTYANGCQSASALQLCSTTDPRGGRTTFDYETLTVDASTMVGPSHLGVITDRAGSRTIIGAHASPDYVTADVAAERTQFSSIDVAGRIGRVDAGTTSGTWSHQAQYTWDTPSNACRQPDALVDNNLCRAVHLSLTTATPDQDTAYIYNSEGQRLVERQVVDGGTVRYRTAGYSGRYLQTTGVFSSYNDSVAGSGNVVSAAGRGMGGRRIDSQTLLYLSDLTQTLTPRGNGTGSGYSPYLTTYHLDNNASLNPNMAVGGGTCAVLGQLSGNTGNVCEIDAPAFDGTNATTTRSVYNAAGQPIRLISPKSIAESPPGQTPAATAYTYYTSADRDLSGTSGTGGWLKAVTDVNGAFVAMAYDAAGNIARTWDRDATAGHAVTDFPGATASPPSSAYTETLHGTGTAPYTQPWRYALSQRDQLGNLTAFIVDLNGNQTTIRPPRGTAAASTAYDTTQSFDARDQLLTMQLPSGAKSTLAYDAYGNLVATTDPNGNVVVRQYDAVNRLQATYSTRGPWPTDQTTVPSGCLQRATTAADQPPISAGKLMCSTAAIYDGVDNMRATSDANQQTTWFTYNAIHERLTKGVPRIDGTYGMLTTGTAYDLDGNTTDACPPREYAEGNGVCSSTAPFSVHMTYDALGRTTSTTTYRDVAGPPNTTRTTYDADGNITSTTDQNGNRTSNAFDLLDRRISQAVPRDSSTANTTRWLYDASGMVTAKILPGSQGDLVTAYSYDAAHRAVDTVQGADSTDATQAGLVDSAGGVNIRTRQLYDADGHVVAAFDPRAFVATQAYPNPKVGPDPTFMLRTDYNADGRAIAQWVPRYDAGPHSDPTLSPTQSGQCPTNPAPQPVSGVPTYPSNLGVCVTRITYDAAGNRSVVRMPTSNGTDNRYTQYLYTDDNLLLTVDGPSGDPTTSSSNGCTQPQTRPAGSAARADTCYVYDADGKPVRLTDPLGHQTTTAYTSDELVKSTTDQYLRVTTHAFDANGNHVRVTDPLGNSTTSTYYADNHLKSSADPLSNTTTYAYDSVGNTVQIASPTANAPTIDPSNTARATTTTAFTADNLVASITVPVSPDGNQRRRTTYHYDPSGRKLSQDVGMVDGSGASLGSVATQSFSYFNDGRLNVQTGRDGSRITTTYDPAGNRTQVSDTTGGGALGAGSTVTSTFYLDNLPRTVDDGRWTTTYSYDGLGSRAARVDSLDGASTQYRTNYQFGDAELPTKMDAASITTTTGTGSTSTTWGYDLAGRPSSEMHGNNQTTAWLFNPDDTLNTLTVRDRNQNAIARWTYTYDADKRQLTQDFTGVGAQGPQSPVQGKFSYVYDAAGRVTQYTIWTLTGGNTTQQVGWDPNGNRILAGQTTWKYNADGSIASMQPPNLPAQNYSYAATGELSADGCATYQYDGFGRLSTVTQQPSTTCPAPTPGPTTYAYDGLDRQRGRVDGTTSPTLFHHDGLGAAISIETTGTAPAANDTVYMLDAAGTRRAAAKQAQAGPATIQYLAGDGFGNVTTVTAPDGSLACTARFDAFGVAQGALSLTNPCNTGSAVSTAFYRGGRPDAATGQYLFGSRVYDPARGSFNQPDSYRSAQPGAALTLASDPMTANAFSYANGDPVNFWDPDGHCSRVDGVYVPCDNPSPQAQQNYQQHLTQQQATYYSPAPPSPHESARPVSAYLSTARRDTRDDTADADAYAAQKRAEITARGDLRHHLQANGFDTVSYGGNLGSGFGVSVDLLSGKCITCNYDRTVDGHTFGWNGQTWDCSPRTHGATCDESHTYAWSGKEVVEYDDGVKSGGFWFQAGQWAWDHKVDIAMLAITVVPIAGELADVALAARIAEETSALATASRTAFTAAEEAKNFTVPLKHVFGAAGRWAKFGQGVDANAAIGDALRSADAVFSPNNVEGAFRVTTNLGRVIGSRGETALRVVVGDDGAIWTAFPVK
ncbi:MAG TPA: kelch repeat-containing protein [Candidatus Dormibacteraeota bacterium]|jgi:RHS repeat-associated protein/uncharacterized repeat protein (TIGR01451 family)|nr:kelch repeat-containing protein [Candidatus Dormibacteraeota bacterium]